MKNPKPFYDSIEEDHKEWLTRQQIARERLVEDIQGVTDGGTKRKHDGDRGRAENPTVLPRKRKPAAR